MSEIPIENPYLDDGNMSFTEEDNLDDINVIEADNDAIDDIRNLLEDALTAVHHNFEAMHTLLQDASEEILISVDNVQLCTDEIDAIKMNLTSKTEQLAGLGQGLNMAYHGADDGIQDEPQDTNRNLE